MSETLIERLSVTELPLLHYSQKPPATIHSVKQEKSHHKPRGFWFSVGDGEGSWKDWCEGEQWGLERLVNPVEVILSDTANIRRIVNATQLKRFTVAYDDVSAAPGGGTAGGLDWRGHYINWPQVAKDYDGIIIAPYLWECRFDPSWYYSWDCASGCIWNADAVAALKARAATRPDPLTLGER